MTHRRRKRTGAEQPVKEFVTVAFAEDIDLARQYKKLLNDNDIPATVRTPEESQEPAPGVAVMVPEDFLDEAHVLIESQGAYGDFYDFVFHDTEDAADADSEEEA